MNRSKIDSIVGIGDDLLLFHVTPTFNYPSIAKNGVNPAFSLGKTQESWWADLWAVNWAILHVSLWKAVPARYITVFGKWSSTMTVRSDGFISHGKGRYHTPHIMTPDTYWTMEEFVDLLEKRL